MPQTDDAGSDTFQISLTYADASAAIDWLERAFGFRRRLVVPGAEGTVMHSELTFGTGVVMVSSPKSEQHRVALRGARETAHTVCVRVEDPDTLFAQATAAGAEVMRELRDEDYGSRGFMVRDLEGHPWYFGTYRPGAHW